MNSAGAVIAGATMNPTMKRIELVCRFCHSINQPGVLRFNGEFTCADCLKERSALHVPKLAEFDTTQ